MEGLEQQCLAAGRYYELSHEIWLHSTCREWQRTQSVYHGEGELFEYGKAGNLSQGVRVAIPTVITNQGTCRTVVGTAGYCGWRSPSGGTGLSRMGKLRSSSKGLRHDT